MLGYLFRTLWYITEGRKKRERIEEGGLVYKLDHLVFQRGGCFFVKVKKKNKLCKKKNILNASRHERGGASSSRQKKKISTKKNRTETRKSERDKQRDCSTFPVEY